MSTVVLLVLGILAQLGTDIWINSDSLSDWRRVLTKVLERERTAYIDVEALIRRIQVYDADCDASLIRKAYRFGENKHRGQKRDSGEEYFSHPVAVAEILVERNYSDHCIVAALLHDTIEDCEDVDETVIREEFGSDVANLVQSLTNVSKSSKKEGFQQWVKKGEDWLENGELPSEPISKDFRNIVRLLYSAASDGRVMAVKLADRLHNMMTIGNCAEHKQKRVALETLTVFAPLARSLGMHRWRKELEDKAFKTLQRGEWKKMHRLYAKVRGRKSERSDAFKMAEKIEEDLTQLMADHGFDVTITSRVKEPYSVWRKMRESRITEKHNEWILDVIGYRIIVNSRTETVSDEEAKQELRDEAFREVYRALGVIHSNWKAVHGRFKDYISFPKTNGYRSVHTTVAISNSGHAEIQIRTDEIHHEVEHGQSAHWVYRQGFSGKHTEVRNIVRNWKADLQKDFEEQHLEELETVREIVKKQIGFSIICFNESGHTINLPQGSTALDFAYFDDPSTFVFAARAHINGEPRALNAPLRHGETVKITKNGDERMINPGWLTMAASPTAKKTVLRELGLQELEEEFAPKHSPRKILLEKAAASLQFSSTDEMLIWVGKCTFDWHPEGENDQLGSVEQVQASEIIKDAERRKLSARKVFQHALPEEFRQRERERRQATIAVDVEIDGGMHPQIGRCCMPLPGEMVIILREQADGGVLHAIDCAELGNESSTQAKWIDVTWDTARSGNYRSGFVVTLKNCVGALGRICEIVSRQNTNISDMIFVTRKNTEFEIFIEVQVRDREHLANILVAVAGQDEVNKVNRCRNLDALKRNHRVESSGGQIIH